MGSRPTFFTINSGNASPIGSIINKSIIYGTDIMKRIVLRDIIFCY